jgi:hypothetical protein
MATEKTLAELLAGVLTRRDLKEFFQEHGNLSRTEAAARVAQIFDGSTPPAKKELTRADVARTFRNDRLMNESRMIEIRCNCIEPARLKWSAGEPGPLDAIIDRMAQEIADDLDACKAHDEREAKLVRLDWPDDEIAYFLDKYGGSE